MAHARPRQFAYSVAADGVGGAVTSWEESYRGSETDLYAQRVDVDGNLLWPAGGVAVCTATGNQTSARVVTDEAEGAIVVWVDSRGGTEDVYAQRVLAGGGVKWTANGVAVCTAANDQNDPSIVSDNSSGVVIAWHDARNGTAETNIYAQRVDSLGVPMWAANGVGVCTAGGRQNSPRISNIAGGAATIVTWADSRAGNSDIYAARVSPVGALPWTLNGVAVCTATGNQQAPEIAIATTSVIVTWEDRRSGGFDIYAQRIDNFGTPQWAPDGVAQVSAAGDQTAPKIVPDGAGGAYISWTDERSSPSTDAYAQHVSDLGVSSWGANGLPITLSGQVKETPVLAFDGSGLYAAWADATAGNQDVYVQRLHASTGAPQWTANGLPIVTQPHAQADVAIALSDASSAIVTWNDARDDADDDVYAYRLTSTGPLAAVLAPRTGGVSLAPVAPNPVIDGATFRFSVASAGPVAVEIFDMQGRRVRSLLDGQMEPGTRLVRWDGLSDSGATLGSGVYFLRLRSGTESVSREFVKLR